MTVTLEPVDNDHRKVRVAFLADREGVYIYAPTGKRLATIPTPTMPTNLALAKTGTQTFLYITGGRFLYRIEVLTQPKAFDDRP